VNPLDAIRKTERELEAARVALEKAVGGDLMGCPVPVRNAYHEVGRRRAALREAERKRNADEAIHAQRQPEPRAPLPAEAST